MTNGMYTCTERVVRDGFLVAYEGEQMTMDEAISRGLVGPGPEGEPAEAAGEAGQAEGAGDEAEQAEGAGEAGKPAARRGARKAAK